MDNIVHSPFLFLDNKQSKTMKQEIIEELRNELFNTKFCHSDFEKYDVPAMQASNEPFIILIYKDGTHMVQCGAHAIAQYFATESGRMAMFRDPRHPMSAIKYQGEIYDTPRTILYWDGWCLLPITVRGALELWDSLVGRTFEQARIEHMDEYIHRNERLDIRFSSELAERHYRETLAMSDDLADESLARCIDRLSQWKRLAVNHYIQISMDFEDFSYRFTEMVNGEPRICGGIIADMSKDDNRWTLHT